MKYLFLVIFFTSYNFRIYGQELPLLKITEDGQYITTEKNEPFFWLGGTAWEMLHRLNQEESVLYLEDRASKGFTVIQTVVLAELDGLNTPNAYGELPLINHDPTKLNEKYFEHVDYVIQQAQKLGLYIGLLPTWGDKYNKKWGVGPEIFTPDNSEIFGELLAQRYQNQNNIIWILGGDRLPENDTHREIILSMARGIRKIDSSHLITYHPWGGVKARDIFNENWLDLDMFQTGHDRRAKDYEFVAASRALIPKKPVINGEARYENIPDQLNKDPLLYGWMDDSDIRASAYWTMLAGAAGYTYGCNNIWQMYTIDKEPIIQARTDWEEAIHFPGSRHVMYMKELLELFPWQRMTNDQSIILSENPDDSTHIISAIGDKGDFILSYTPMGNPIKLDLSRMNTQMVKAFWYNPRSGKSINLGEHKSTETPVFTPWSIGRGSDFVLVILDTDSNYQLPE